MESAGEYTQRTRKPTPELIAEAHAIGSNLPPFNSQLIAWLQRTIAYWRLCREIDERLGMGPEHLREVDAVIGGREVWLAEELARHGEYTHGEGAW